MIFCVEDDKNINELIMYALRANNFEVMGFEKGSDMFLELEKTSQFSELENLIIFKNSYEL